LNVKSILAIRPPESRDAVEIINRTVGHRPTKRIAKPEKIGHPALAIDFSTR